MQRDDGVYVGHMLDLSRKVAEKIAGVSRKKFDRAHPEIPWAGIVGMRHKVVHDYMAVDDDVVWKTSVEEIPQLVAALERLASD